LSDSPAVAYADTSALAKLVLSEPEAPAFARRLEAHDSVLTSVVGIVELLRAARRELGDPGARQAREVVAALTVVPLSVDLARRAGLIAPDSLRALDAIHLASASVVDGLVGVFYSYDRRLCDAAASLGLAVESPGA
jgi:predicted nucleic acid-binding protein